jgi:poly-gamma-glutamate capsule biosynthesis protein CapA/YwtB (metallophosphatase superfamily)
MGRNKQNIILLAVISVSLIFLVCLKIYGKIKSNNSFSEIKASITDDDISSKRRIAKSEANSKQGDLEDSKSSENHVINSSIQIKSSNAIKITEDNVKENTSKPEPFYIKAVGDIVLGRGVEYHLNNQEKDYTYPFQYVADILRSGDIIFGNLEVPMTESDHGLDPKGKYVIKSREKAAEGIKYAGFNVLNLANNHIMDYYEKGLFDTISTLEKYNIEYCGAGKNIDEARKPATLKVKDTKVAVLGYTDMAEYIYKGNPMISFAAEEDKSGVAPRKYELIKEDIEKIRENVDIIIISLHWGVEDSFEVTEEQKEFAHNLIDDGADIILGHHPHKFQGIEIYEGKPIVYSMGNFIFDQNDPLKQESFIVDMEFINNKLTSLELLPVRTISKTHIIIPKGEEAKELLKRELELCGKLGSKCAIVDDKIVFNIKQ